MDLNLIVVKCSYLIRYHLERLRFKAALNNLKGAFCAPFFYSITLFYSNFNLKTLLNMFLNYNYTEHTLDSYFNSKYLVYSERNK